MNVVLGVGISKEQLEAALASPAMASLLNGASHELRVVEASNFLSRSSPEYEAHMEAQSDSAIEEKISRRYLRKFLGKGNTLRAIVLSELVWVQSSSHHLAHDTIDLASPRFVRHDDGQVEYVG